MVDKCEIIFKLLKCVNFLVSGMILKQFFLIKLLKIFKHSKNNLENTIET